MADIIITPGSSLMSFTSSANFTQTLTQDASGSLILLGSGSTGRTDIFTINGNSGTLFSVSDDLSDSLFSVNTIAGLPVIEAFADNTVKLGKYGAEAIVISGSNNTLQLSGSIKAVSLGTSADTNVVVFNTTTKQIAYNTALSLQGTQGTTGTATQGATGASVQGSQGTTGTATQGATGTSIQGLQGITGTATQGATGTSIQGLQGITGTATQGATGASVQGSQGTTGTATQGATGASVQGSQGTTGTATQGIQGITGTATQGATGTATQGIQGILGNQGITGTGTQGTTGVQGIQGITGGGGSIPGSNNEILTSDGAGGAVAEANLTFDGSTLVLNGSTEISGNSNSLIWTGGDTLYGGGYDILNNLDAVVDQGVTSVNNYSEMTTNWASSQYNGLVLTRVTAAVNVAVGQLLALRNNSTWDLADADSSNSNKLLGICLDAAAEEGETSVLLNGIYTTTYHDQLTPITPGYPLYVSPTTGNVTETAPSSSGQIVRCIGHNLFEGNERAMVRFDPDVTWIVI